MAGEELRYRQERLVWQGDVHWQRTCSPWCLVTTLRGVNISRSGLLAEGEAHAFVAIFTDRETVLHLNDGRCYAAVSAVCVRRQEQRVAFSFDETNTALEELLAQIHGEAQ